ncbi:MAG: alkaline phosphatase D family protein [Myxococcales bacterium]|nr:alkaline phosphatase D family protein [Myxococcales bacterium]
MSTREPPSSSNGDETSTEAPSLLPRRDFLGVAAGAVLSLSGCVDGDDAAPAMTDGTDGTGGTGGTDDSTGEPMPEPPDAGEPGVPFDPAAIPESVELFPRTPMAGEMKPSSFMIAGYVETGEDVTVRVWQPGAVEGEVHLRLDVLVTPDANGFLKVEVDGLQGGEWYDYGLFAGDADAGFSARSLLGRARTALPDGVAEPVRIAIAACIGRGLILPEYIDPDDPRPAAPWDTMQRAAEHDYDIFIHLGDQGYFDDVYAAGGSYEQYLAAWGVLHGGGYRAVYPRSGLYCTWDDHEVTNNGTVDPWTTDPTELARIEAAHRAFFTVIPIDASEPGLDPLWRSFRWGDTVEFIVLDCRSERQPPESGVYLGEEQFAFLLDRLLSSPCRFKCIVNSVPFSRFNLPEDEPLASALIDPRDRWEGYVTQRAELQAFVDEHDLRGILWITGDVHMCYVGQVDADPTTAGESMWEVCVTSGNINPLASLLSTTQFPWRSQDPHVPLITFDPGNDVVLVELVDTDGRIAHSQELVLG